MRTILGSSILIALVVGGCPTVRADAITISVVPTTQTVPPGSLVNVSLKIAGLGEPPSLGTFDLNLGFDPTILSFNSAIFGDPVLGDQLDPTGGGNTINFVNPGIGSVELFDLSLDTASDLNSLQAPSFTLGELTFDALGVGVSPLTLGVFSLGDQDGIPLSAALLDGIVGVNVSSVPEPSSFALSALAFLGTWLLHRRVSRRRDVR